jgi:hypothetical protein
MRMCTATARFVGYAVPCPLTVPRELSADTSGGGCAGGVVFAPFRRAATCQGARGWRGWVAGASSTPGGTHLALTASPRLEPDIAKLVNGPAWYRGARVRLLGRSRMRGWSVRWAFVSAGTNDGSQFSDAVVASWSTSAHSYAIGVRSGARLTDQRALVERLLEDVALVGPHG